MNTETDIEDRIRQIIAENFGLEKVHDDQSMEGVDPLDWVEAIVCIEKEFGIAMDEDDDFETAGEIVKWAAKAVGNK